MTIKVAEKNGIRDFAQGRSETYQIDPRDIEVRDGWNSRNPDDQKNVEHIEMLAASIAQVGVKQPLTCYTEGGRVFVTDGHCRLAAVKLAISRGIEIKTVPVQSEGRFANEGDRVFSQVIRNAGKPLESIELAAVYKRLIDLGWKPDQIAEKAGRARAHVVDLLNLHAAPQQITDMVKEGTISASLARKTLREERGNGGKAVERLTEAATKAKETGKKRATAKHMTTADTTPQGVVANALRGAKRGPDGAVMLYLTDEAFRAICLACRVPIDLPSAA